MLVDDRNDIGNFGINRGKFKEGAIEGFGKYPRKGSFSGSRRAPEYHRRKKAGSDEFTDDTVFTHEVGLTDDVIECFRPKNICKRLRCGHRPYSTTELRHIRVGTNMTFGPSLKRAGSTISVRTGSV